MSENEELLRKLCAWALNRERSGAAPFPVVLSLGQKPAWSFSPEKLFPYPFKEAQCQNLQQFKRRYLKERL